jgi:hypothetical protein
MKRNLVWLLLFGWSVSHAQIYSCRDASGRHIVADRPVPECMNRAIREMLNNGVIKREIRPPLTAEDRRKAQEEEVRLAREQAAQRQEHQRDQALLLRFSSERDIEAARSRELAMMRERIAAGQKTASTAAPDSGNAEATLKHSADTGGQSAFESNAPHSRHDANIVAVNKKYDEISARFRVLMARSIATARPDVVRTKIESPESGPAR